MQVPGDAVLRTRAARLRSPDLSAERFSSSTDRAHTSLNRFRRSPARMPAHSVTLNGLKHRM